MNKTIIGIKGKIGTGMSSFGYDLMRYLNEKENKKYKDKG